jgi:hypothetical protein
VVLSVAVLCFLVVAGARPDPAAATDSSCPTMRVFGVRGSGETKSDYGGYGRTVYDAIQEIYDKDPSAQISPIDYEAIGVEPLNPSYDLGGYTHSVATGDQALLSAINNWIAGPCGKTTYIYLIGYSQGAQVVGDVYQKQLTSSAKGRVKGVVLIGDPQFNPSQPAGVDVGSYQKMIGVYTSFTLGSPRKVTSSEAQNVRDYCHINDPVCNWSLRNGIGCKVFASNCAHTTYFQEDLSNSTTYTVAAGDFLVARWRAVGPTITHVGSRTSILFYGNGGDSSDTGGFSNLEGALVSAGYDVHFAQSLPADISAYGQVWEYGLGVITTAQQEQELINYARSGGSLFLTGEWNGCCQSPSNDAVIKAIFDGLVVTVGGMQFGPDDDSFGADPVNTHAIDGVATTPNKLTTFTGAAVGAISATNVDPNNFLFTDSNGAGVVGVWDNHNVVGGGRLAIVMDTNWVADAYQDSATVPGIVQNLAYFLSGGATP